MRLETIDTRFVPLGACCTLPGVPRPGDAPRGGRLPERLATFLAALVVPVLAASRRAAPPAARTADRLTGFRSARFGMTAAQVRWAVARDFPQAAVQFDDTALRVTLAALEPAPGTATVSYQLGADGRLERVDIAWRTPDAPGDVQRNALAAAGLQLAAHFGSRGWGPGGTVGHRAEGPNAILLFAGWDRGQAAVELRLAGVQLAVAGGRGPAPGGAAELRLGYRRAA